MRDHLITSEHGELLLRRFEKKNLMLIISDEREVTILTDSQDTSELVIELSGR